MASNENTDINPTENNRLEFKLGESCSNVFLPNVTQSNSTPSDSFVVINGSPIEEVEAFSMANLQDVQSKALTIDYISLISNINPEEIEQKLVEVLQENSKLKETLIRNNDAMKKNFTSLVSWQKNVDSILNHHKTKFSEIRDLVYQLKKENTDLKMQIANNIDGSLGYKDRILQSPSMEIVDAVKKRRSCDKTTSLQMTEKDSLDLLLDYAKCSETKVENAEQNVGVIDEFANYLQLSINSKKQSLENIGVASDVPTETQSLNLQSIEPKIQSVSEPNIDLTTQKNEQKLISTVIKDTKSQSFVQYESAPNSIQNKNSISNGEKMYSEIESKVIELRDNFEKLNLPSEPETNSSHRNHLIANVKQYKDQLEKIVNLYTKERTRFRVVQENLITCEKILSEIDLLKEKGSENSSIIQEGQNHIEKLRSQFLQDIMMYGDENKKLIEMQKLYQQIFWDYSSLINDLEIIEEENFKLKAVEDNVKQKNEVLENLTKEYVEKMRVLSLRDKELDEREASLLKNQNLLSEQLKELATKKYVLDAKMQQCNEEIEKLKEEKNSLDRQSELYENKRMTESMENVTVQMKLKEQHELDMKNMQLVIEDLRTQLEKKKEECESAVVAVELQLQYYRNDYEAERLNKEELLREREVLKENIATLQRERSAGSRPASAAQKSLYCSICARYIQPGENHGWNFCNMEFD